jgi:hypothetical protein
MLDFRKPKGKSFICKDEELISTFTCTPRINQNYKDMYPINTKVYRRLL